MGLLDRAMRGEGKPLEAQAAPGIGLLKRAAQGKARPVSAGKGLLGRAANLRAPERGLKKKLPGLKRR